MREWVHGRRVGPEGVLTLHLHLKAEDVAPSPTTVPVPVPQSRSSPTATTASLCITSLLAPVHGVIWGEFWSRRSALRQGRVREASGQASIVRMQRCSKLVRWSRTGNL